MESIDENPIIEVGDADFEEKVLKSDFPVLVDFWASWCGPCKSIAPIVEEVEEVAREYAQKLKVAKFDVDTGSKVAQKYDIRGIPTLILFKNGDILAQRVGALTKAQLCEFLDKDL